jgi:hypothetical protein
LQRIHQLERAPQTWLRHLCQEIIERLSSEDHLDILLRFQLEGSISEKNESSEILRELGFTSVKYFLDAIRRARQPSQRQTLSDLLISIFAVEDDEEEEIVLEPDVILQPLLILLEGRHVEADVARTLFQLGWRLSAPQMEQQMLAMMESTDANVCARTAWSAIQMDTPVLNKSLYHLLQRGILQLEPELEEQIVVHLDQAHLLDGVEWLAERLKDPDQHIEIRASAVWALGSFRSQKAIELLQSILTERKGLVFRQLAYPEELRLQAVDAVNRLPYKVAQPLLKLAAQDPSPMVRKYVRRLSS